MVIGGEESLPKTSKGGIDCFPRLNTVVTNDKICHHIGEGYESFCRIGNPQNFGSARLMGLSTVLAGRLSERWSIVSSLTWTDGIDRTTGQSLLRLPNLQANVALRYGAGEQRAFSILTNYVSDRIDLDFSIYFIHTRFETLSGIPGPGRTVFMQVTGDF